jgi:hypothetical protein
MTRTSRSLRSLASGEPRSLSLARMLYLCTQKVEMENIVWSIRFRSLNSVTELVVEVDHQHLVFGALPNDGVARDESLIERSVRFVLFEVPDASWTNS